MTQCEGCNSYKMFVCSFQNGTLLPWSGEHLADCDNPGLWRPTERCLGRWTRRGQHSNPFDNQSRELPSHVLLHSRGLWALPILQTLLRQRDLPPMYEKRKNGSLACFSSFSTWWHLSNILSDPVSQPSEEKLTSQKRPAVMQGDAKAAQKNAGLHLPIGQWKRVQLIPQSVTKVPLIVLSSQMACFQFYLLWYLMVNAWRPCDSLIQRRYLIFLY